MNTLRKCGLLLLVILSSGCSSIHYRQTQEGELNGKLLVQWVGPDSFLFKPDEKDPLIFKRANGESIQPGEMHTDGGSIPRPLWAIKGYSPWGYGPAFIVHDWLFEAHHCQVEDYAHYDHHEAADVMSEVIKTIMVKDEVNKFVMWTMHEAVNSKIAEHVWNNGECGAYKLESLNLRPQAAYVIEYRDGKLVRHGNDQ